IAHAFKQNIDGVRQFSAAHRARFLAHGDRQRPSDDTHATLVEIARARDAAVIAQAWARELRVAVQQLQFPSALFAGAIDTAGRLEVTGVERLLRSVSGPAEC